MYVSVCVRERDRDRAHFASLPHIPSREAPSPHHCPSLHISAGQLGVDSPAQQPIVGVGEDTNPLPLKKLARPMKSHPRLPQPQHHCPLDVWNSQHEEAKDEGKLAVTCAAFLLPF